MSACCSGFGEAAERQFNERKAAQEVADYRTNGPAVTTRLLRDGIKRAGAASGVLLDIGAGIGGLTFEMLESGMARAVAVDASSAYLAEARVEAARRRRAEVITWVHGDFVTVAPDLPPAEVVALDRVICCYPRYESLLQAAATHANRCIAMSYPRETWYVRAGGLLENGRRRLASNPFRTFVHSRDAMEQIIHAAGFHLSSRRETWVWSADVYVRTG